MSDISGGRRNYGRIEYEVPLRCNTVTGSSGHQWAGARAVDDLLRRMRQAATEHGIDTNHDDWFHIDAYEDDRLVFWFDIPDSAKWTGGK